MVFHGASLELLFPRARARTALKNPKASLELPLFMDSRNSIFDLDNLCKVRFRQVFTVNDVWFYEVLDIKFC